MSYSAEVVSPHGPISPAQTAQRLADDRDALGFNVRDACEEPLMRLEQVGGILLMAIERMGRCSDSTAAGALDLAHTTLRNEVEALRKALRLSNPD